MEASETTDHEKPLLCTQHMLGPGCVDINHTGSRCSLPEGRRGHLHLKQAGVDAVTVVFTM